MKVSDLIKLLKTLDQDKNIFVFYDHYYFQSVEIEKVNSLSASDLEHSQSMPGLSVSLDDYFIDAY